MTRAALHPPFHPRGAGAGLHSPDGGASTSAPGGGSAASAAVEGTGGGATKRWRTRPEVQLLALDMVCVSGEGRER